MEDQNPKPSPECPRCSYALELGAPTVREDLKLQYTRALLGDTLFTWSVEYGGIRIAFSDLTRSEASLKERCKKLLAETAADNNILTDLTNHLETTQDEKGLALIQHALAYKGLLSSISTAASLIDAAFHLRQIGDISYDFTNKISEADPQTAEEVVQLIEELFESFQEAKVELVVNMSDMFRRIVAAIKESCYDANFWEGAGFVPLSEPTEKAQ